MKIATHNGHFHTDDLLAVSVLLLKFPDAEVVRTRDEEIINSADIVVDVGLKYDPKNKRFDHHQAGGAGKRENGAPYAAFGLVWKEYGAELAGGKEEAEVIEEKLAIPVDLGDNGVDFYTPMIEGVSEYSLGDYFESFVSGARSMEDYDRIFFETLPIAVELLKREINLAKKSVADWKEVRRLYEESEDKRIITLPAYLHWKNVLAETDAMFVIYPRPNGHWCAQAVPKKLNGFENKKDFPAAWAGLKSDMLAMASGVTDAVFCHSGRYLCVAMSREGAKKLAAIALKSK